MWGLQLPVAIQAELTSAVPVQPTICISLQLRSNKAMMSEPSNFAMTKAVSFHAPAQASLLLLGTFNQQQHVSAVAWALANVNANASM